MVKKNNETFVLMPHSAPSPPPAARRARRCAAVAGPTRQLDEVDAKTWGALALWALTAHT